MQCEICGKEMNMESPLKEVIDAIYEAANKNPDIGICMDGDTCKEFNIQVWMRSQKCKEK